MTYQEQHKALENRIISSLCEIKEYPLLYTIIISG
jgi:hypothetical protein